jgi:hypothetical protein
MAMMERGVGKFEINVRDEFGVSRTLFVDPDCTVESLHEQLREITGVSRDTQILTYQGQNLYDRRSVHDYNLKPCTTLFLKRVSKEQKYEHLMISAIMWDDGCMVQTLLDQGYEVTTPFQTLASSPMGDTSRGSHPLHYAALCLSANSLVVLLRAGAPTEAVCPECFVGPDRGRSALTNAKAMHIATAAASATGSDNGVITHLLLHDADVDSKCERANLITGAAFSGCTPLHVAAALENEHVIATLIERNADLEAFMFEGAAIKTGRGMLESLISTRQIMQQAGLRNFNGEPTQQVLYG